LIRCRAGNSIAAALTKDSRAPLTSEAMVPGDVAAAACRGDDLVAIEKGVVNGGAEAPRRSDQ
jgi:hypothetical protein